jgi:RimJ/RimL family protein N-acetyltransferase
MRTPGPIALTDPTSGVRLEPLARDHVDALFAAGSTDTDEVFRWTSSVWRPMHAREDAVWAVELALGQRDAGTRVPWVVLDAEGTVAGSTSLLDIAVADARVEIGATWLGRRWWRTAVNTAAKRALLAHAFEGLGARRVALKTDHENLRSQEAIARLGAVHEGVLRSHMRRADGTWRDTVYYSILDEEWPRVRELLARDRGV